MRALVARYKSQKPPLSEKEYLAKMKGYRDLISITYEDQFKKAMDAWIAQRPESVTGFEWISRKIGVKWVKSGKGYKEQTPRLYDFSEFGSPADPYTCKTKDVSVQGNKVSISGKKVTIPTEVEASFSPDPLYGEWRLNNLMPVLPALGKVSVRISSGPGPAKARLEELGPVNIFSIGTEGFQTLNANGAATELTVRMNCAAEVKGATGKYKIVYTTPEKQPGTLEGTFTYNCVKSDAKAVSPTKLYGYTGEEVQAPLEVSNAGKADLHVRVTSIPQWLKISPPVGTIMKFSGSAPYPGVRQQTSTVSGLSASGITLSTACEDDRSGKITLETDDPAHSSLVLDVSRTCAPPPQLEHRVQGRPIINEQQLTCAVQKTIIDKKETLSSIRALNDWTPLKFKVTLDGVVLGDLEGSAAASISGETASVGTHTLVAELTATRNGMQKTFTEVHTFDISPPITEIAPHPCSPADSPDPGGMGSTHGEPYLDSFDGTRMAFQQVGEYVLAKSLKQGSTFEVQARFSPFDRRTSANAALAMRVVNDRVAVYAHRNAAPTLKVNGQVQTFDGNPFALALPSGGMVSGSGKWLMVEWPDGSYVSMMLDLGVVGSVWVHIPGDQRTHMTGLLGNFDGDAKNDFRLRNGTLLGYYPSMHDIWTRFGESWRIGQEESLFDYEPGTSTLNFTDRTHPDSIITLSGFDAETVKRAEEVCKAAGVYSETRLQQCMTDVAVTGDPNWAYFSVFVDPRARQIQVSPLAATLQPGEQRAFGAIIPPLLENREVTWEASAGTVTVTSSNSISYTAPATPGRYTLTARLKSHPEVAFEVPVSVQGTGQGYQVQMYWSGGMYPSPSSDLDGHLWLPESQKYHLYYARKGDEYSKANLDQDHRADFGGETITIQPLQVDGHYEYWVHNYSPEVYDLNKASVYLMDLEGNMLQRFESDPETRAPWWHVFNLDARTGEVTVVNHFGTLQEPYWDQGADCSAPQVVTTKTIWTPCAPHPVQ